MRAWDWVLAGACAAWALALLWITAPEHAIFRLLASDSVASWVGAIGSVAAAFAVVAVARWEVNRSEREAKRSEREVLETVIVVAARGVHYANTLIESASIRPQFGLPLDEDLRRYRERNGLLTASMNRLLVGRQPRAETLLLAESLLGELARVPPNANPDLVAIDAREAKLRFEQVEARAKELLAQL